MTFLVFKLKAKGTRSTSFIRRHAGVTPALRFPSCNQRVHYFRWDHACQLLFQALKFKCQSFVINPEQTEQSRVEIADVNRVANKYLQPDRMAIVIVGDRKVIEPELQKLNIGTIEVRDAEGRLIR